MYPTSGATLRGDINTVVEEALFADKWFIGQQVFPPAPVSVKAGQYPKVQIAKGQLLENTVTKRTAGGVYGEMTREWTTDTYDCADYGLEEPVDDTVAKDLARFFPVEAAKARLCLRNLMTGMEVRVAAQLMSTGNFGAATASTVAYTVANKATVDFPTDVLAAIERVNDNGGQANTIVMSSTVLNRLKMTTLLQNFVRGNRPNDSTLNLTAQAVAEAFRDNGITQCLIGRARYNQAKRGQNYSASSVWGTAYVWVGNVTGGDPHMGGAGRILSWTEDGGILVSETYRDEKRRSNMVRVRQNVAEKCIDGTSGTLIDTQWG